MVGVIPAGLGVPAGHPDRDALVEAEDVLDIAVGEGVNHWQLGGARIAENVADAVLGASTNSSAPV